MKVHVLGIDQISLILYHYSQSLSKRQGGTLARSTEEGICEHFTATACEAYTAALPRVKLDTARLSEVFTSTRQSSYRASCHASRIFSSC